MKIGIFSGGRVAHLLAGGGSTYQHTVLAALAKNRGKHTFYLFCDDQYAGTLYSGLNSVPWHRFYPQSGDSLLKKVLLKGLRAWDKRRVVRQYKNFLHREVIEHKIDLMWFLIPSYFPVDVPYISTVWDLQHRLQPYFPEVSVAGSSYDEREKLYAHALPQASYVLVGNQAGKEEIERFYGLPAWRIKINPLPTPPFVFNQTIQPFINLQGLGITKPYLFYPAQFWPHKNHVIILHAARLLKERYGVSFDIVFTGVDKGNMTYVKEVSATLGLQEDVHVLGFVDTGTLVALYQHAFALVFASFFGPDNIPPLEAFGLGCPVIASRVSGSAYQLQDAALLFNPLSENDLVEKILCLYHNQQLRDGLCSKGLQRAQLYSSENYITTMHQIFDEFELIRRCWSSEKRYHHL